MIKAGVKYMDQNGTELPAMHAGTVEGEFWCARLGDSRYYSADGTCLRLYGTANGGENLSPDKGRNIKAELGDGA